MLAGFHLATKIWGGSALNEWAYLALIFGCANGRAAIFILRLVGYRIGQPFTQHLINWGMGTISNSLLWVLVPALDRATDDDFLCCTVDPHKALQESREDVLPNEHIFAERYYDND